MYQERHKQWTSHLTLRKSLFSHIKQKEKLERKVSFQEVQCIQNTAFQHFFPGAFVHTNKFPDQKASHNPHFTWKFICLLNRPQKIQTATSDGGGREVREGSFIFRLFGSTYQAL